CCFASFSLHPRIALSRADCLLCLFRNRQLAVLTSLRDSLIPPRLISVVLKVIRDGLLLFLSQVRQLYGEEPEPLRGQSARVPGILRGRHKARRSGCLSTREC